MPTRPDDLVPFLAERPRAGLQLRQGVATAWNTTTGANTVTVGSNAYTNLPVIGALTGITAGNQVMVLSTGKSIYVLGKLTKP